MKRIQILLPIATLLNKWEQDQFNPERRWIRRNWHGRMEMSVDLIGGRWITCYMVSSSDFKQENPDQERLGFLTVQEARDYCDRAAARQGYSLQ